MTTQSVSAYPLSWPAGWKRTAASERRRATFNTKGRSDSGFARTRELSIADAIGRLVAQLRALGSRGDYIISTNLILRNDGLPRSDQRDPSDPGAAVYWTYDGQPQSMGIDQYTRVADNIAAIAATLEHLRGVDRHGGAQILKRAFTGFAALPAPENSPVGWWGVLGVERMAAVDEIKAAYRTLAKKLHPDNGETGDAEKFVVVDKAYKMAKDERKF